MKPALSLLSTLVCSLAASPLYAASPREAVGGDNTLVWIASAPFLLLFIGVALFLGRELLVGDGGGRKPGHSRH